ncbi:MAG: hypothetical protein ACJAYN_001862 [Bermanella sp.]|jgi:hypothetical protein|nr:hypothetical protein [Glaciecola sp. 33A]
MTSDSDLIIQLITVKVVEIATVEVPKTLKYQAKTYDKSKV